MNRHRLAYAAAAVLLGIALIAAMAGVTIARLDRDAERRRWDEAMAEARRTRTLLSRLPVSNDGAPQPDRVATVARRVLVTAGIGQDVLAGIQPLGDAALPGGAWHRQQVLVQFRGLTTSQAAAVVDAVARTDPSWAVTSVQLSHAGTGDRYDAGIALTSLYPAHP